MRPRLILVLAAIVAVPLGLLAWLGARAVRDDRERVERSLRQLAESRLAAVDDRIQRLLEEYQQRLAALAVAGRQDAAALRQLVRTTPEIDGLFVQDASGRLLFPPLGGGLARDETAFLVRIRRILEERLLLAAPMAEQPAAQRQVGKGGASPDAGWYPWYWESGLHLIWWRRLPDGGVAGIEVSPIRLMADIVAVLPPADAGGVGLGSGERMTLLDGNRREVYRWGALAPESRGTMTAVRSLSPPLGSWSLRHERSEEGSSAGVFLRVWGLVIAGCLLTGLSVLFYRESSRELREARDRVRFVNQVSHELRTPLTNIRLYAELLEGRLDEDDAAARADVDVIVSESQRLSRLIGNVLAFSRHQRGELKVAVKPDRIDPVIRGVAEQFGPALAGRGVAVALALEAPAPTRFDRDAVEQILGNLLGNVEKYAPGSGVVEIRSSQQGGRTTVRVADRGPGIPRQHAERVFEPFVRLSDRLTEGVSGTGIGLAIARDLARLQGGELRLAPDGPGACLELELPCADAAEASRPDPEVASP